MIKKRIERLETSKPIDNSVFVIDMDESGIYYIGESAIGGEERLNTVLKAVDNCTKKAKIKPVFIIDDL